jgi:hypothetical protein
VQCTFIGQFGDDPTALSPAMPNTRNTSVNSLAADSSPQQGDQARESGQAQPI